MTTPPPRIRDIQAVRDVARRRGRRSVMFVALWITIPVVLVLVYGLLRQTVFEPHVDATIDRSDMIVREGEKIQINVVNACGADGAARQCTEFLRARGFDVAENMTAETHETYSRVLDRVGDPISSRKVAYALGVDQTFIETAIDSSLYLRATVILGEDFRKLRPWR